MPSIQPPRGSGPMQRGGLSSRQPFRNFRSPEFFSDATYKISGVTKDSTGAALPNCIVNLFYSRDDTLAATVESSSVGEFTFWVTPNLFFYIVAYKAGIPDVAGTTVNTLIATLSGEIPNYDASAQEYFNRVADAGGLISLATKQKVSDFVVSAKAHGYWTKLNRINLFVGDFTALFIPLKVGAGLAIDTNFNFVAGDYSEATGLTGNATTKYLNTGVPLNTFDETDIHFGCYNATSYAAAASSDFMGVYNSSTGIQVLTLKNVDALRTYIFGIAAANSYGIPRNDPANNAVGHVVANNSVCYLNGAVFGISGGGGPLAISTSESIFVFAVNISGSAGGHINASLRAYHMGTALSAGEITSFNTDMEVFQDALGRGVQ